MELENIKDKNVRVLYHGRALENATLLSAAGIRPESIVHVSVGARVAARPKRAAAPRVAGARRPLVPIEDDSSDSEEELSGFDRLREMGFSADDVRQFRMQFYLNHFRNAPIGGPAHPVPQSPEMVRLENQWIDTQFNPAQMAANPANGLPAHPQLAAGAAGDANGALRQPLESGLAFATRLTELGSADGNGFNLLIGLIFGFLLGLISLFWIGEPYLTRKTRLGMVCGIMGNVCLGLIAVR